jgi:glucose-6-phosphate dehydrogenase assembly protein OpcA
VPISPEEIEASLSELWTRDPLAGASRLCTTNLLVFLSNREQQDQTHEVLSKLVATNPGRSVVVVPVPGLQELRAYVAARCELPTDRVPPVCCDQILLEADSPLMSRVLSLVAEILVPELPVFAWWRGDLPAPGQFPLDPLKGLLTRLIFDSQEFTTWASYHRASLLAQALECHLGDLAWDRLSPWRAAALAALTAEETSTARREFNNLQFSMARGSNFAQPLLFACWVASLLNLQPEAASQTADQLQIRFRGGGSLRVGWDMQEAPGFPPGSLLSIRLANHDHWLEISHTPHGCLQCTAQVHSRQWHSVLNWADLPLHQLLSVELSQFGKDEELEQSLGLALKTLRLLGINVE